MPTNFSQLKMSGTKMVSCFEKLGRMVSHSLHLATVVRGRIGGEGEGGRQMHPFGAFASNLNKIK